MLCLGVIRVEWLYAFLCVVRVEGLYALFRCGSCSKALCFV